MENSANHRLRGSALFAVPAVACLFAAIAALTGCPNPIEPVPSPSPTAAPAASSTPLASATPSPGASTSPTASPSASPSASPTASPTASPSPSPSASPSPSPTASPGAPPKPQPAVFAGTSSATISWPDVPGATSYNIYWSGSSSVTKSTGTCIAGAVSPYTQSSLTNGSYYYYVVTALNGAAESADSAVVYGRPIAAPAKPTVNAAFGGTSLSWSYASGASSYNIYWSTSPGVTPSTGAKLSSSASPYAHAGLAGGTRYYYVLTGANSNGESNASPEASAIALFDPYHSAQWASAPAGSAASEFRGAAADGNGNRIAAGRQYGNASFSYGASASATGGYASGYNAVVVKYDSSGNALWARSVTGTGLGESGFHAVAVDASGAVYAAGYICGSSTYDFGGHAVTGKASSVSFVLVKYDADGNVQWADTVVSSIAPDTIFYSVAVDGAGRVYAAGTVSGPSMWDFQLSATVTVKAVPGGASATNALVARYDSDGQALWGQTVATAPSNSRFNGIAADASGNAYACGYIGGNSSFSFGNGATASGSNAGANNISSVLVKYDPSGKAQWARAAASADSSTSGSCFYGVAASEALDSVYAVGSLHGAATYSWGGSAQATGAGAGYDFAALVKFDLSGNAQWARTSAPASSLSVFNGAAIDGSGNCLAGGYLYGSSTADFGNGIGANGAVSGKNSLLLAKYGSDGTALWAQSAVSASAENRYGAVAADSAGKAFAVGYSTGSSSIGLGNAVSATGSASGSNALAASYAP